jgi:hypothetical protein
MQPVVLLELNEINFDFVRAYGRRGLLPTLNGLIGRHGLSETSSETRHEDIEPWIQWVTAHTGLTLAEHGIFRLGDVVDHDIPQIWERLEAKGLKVGAVSPMNAKNRTRDAAFFMPDPWTRTEVTGSRLLRRLYGAIAQAVNDNASARVTPQSLIWLGLGTMRHARPANYARYAGYAAGARARPWSRACFLDLLLADIFVDALGRTRPQFASLFLNAGAHIQHHYMFSSGAYDGAKRNPEWYIEPRHDPLLEVYALYDRITADILRARPGQRLMIATGLHQTPHEELTFYWRLRDHAAFLRTVGARFRAASPRMSRDFLVECASAEDARFTEDVLRSVTALDGQILFEVDNRGQDLFVTLAYPHEIQKGFEVRIGDGQVRDLSGDVVFVAVKNGEHDGIGYFLDTGAAPQGRFPLTDMVRIIETALAA